MDFRRLFLSSIASSVTIFILAATFPCYMPRAPLLLHLLSHVRRVLNDDRCPLFSAVRQRPVQLCSEVRSSMFRPFADTHSYYGLIRLLTVRFSYIEPIGSQSVRPPRVSGIFFPSALPHLPDALT